MDIEYNQIIEELNRADLKRLTPLHITILRNIMIEPIVPYLQYHAYKIGYHGIVHFGEYDNIFQESVGGRPDILNHETDCVLVFMFLDNTSVDLKRNYAGLDQDKIHSEMENIQSQISSILNGIRSQTDAMILWHGFEMPAYPVYGIYDYQTDLGQTSAIGQLNDFLRLSLSQSTNAFFVNTDICRSRLGYNHFYDLRYWHIGRAPYSRAALGEISGENFKFIRSLKGKNKKCLILDCDNTLWGGIIGEDGLSNIQLGKTYPGSIYCEFQQGIVDLYHQGTILALCSRNNEEDVWDVFKNHPDMVLKKDYIAAWQINWDDKAKNIRQIALDLNIGLDSIVFIDDSEFEINLIKREIPEVEAVHVPSNRAVELHDILFSQGWFDTLKVTEEDRKRGAMYKAEAKRKKLHSQTTDLDGFLKSLEMVVDIRFADDFSVPRIAQQTQKTNQFNLTTRRYNDSDIKRFIEGDASDVLYLRLKDKFGDSGIVGTCILRYQNKRAIFDSFLLSCRVLGRGLEEIFILNALKLAKKRECTEALGEFFATQKNQQVDFFYHSQGFKSIDLENSEADKAFIFDLKNYIDKKPKNFKEIHSDIE